MNMHIAPEAPDIRRDLFADFKVRFMNCCCHRHPSGDMSDHGDCNACVRVSEDVMQSAYEICENAAVDARHF